MEQSGRKNMQNEAAECFFTTFRPFALWFEKRSVYLQAKREEWIIHDSAIAEKSK
ncbi:MAG: hypothetical protein MJZ36_04715 [Bacteroidaceae bacterium]|nr:hypothetical protein [Bacteroidaceae bacterium]